MRNFILVPLLVLALVPSWSGEPRLPVYLGTPEVRVRRVALDPRDSARVRVGALTYLGGIQLSSSDPAFGGFSALHVAGDRFTMLSDGGLLFGFRMGSNLVPYAPRFGALPDGPRRGWAKADRDAESMAVDPASGRIWVGFESANMIWRYAPGFTQAEASVRPGAMRRWPEGGGAEAMVRLADGRFLIFSESKSAGKGWRAALLFDRDPTDRRARRFAFAYRPPAGYSPTDAVALPDRRVIILNRKLSLREQFTARVTVIDSAEIHRHARVTGREIAALVPPLLHDNFEALALTREGAHTILWIASDDNPPSFFQRALLLKFRLDLPREASTKSPRSGR